MKKFLVFIFFTLCMSDFLASQCNNADDYVALRALYLNTDGDNWTDNSGWPDAATFIANPTIPSGTDMETWHGVVCQVIKGLPSDKVNYIEIGDNNLVGSLPSEIGGMSILQSLRLNDNSIIGNLSSLSSLNFLNTLDLSRTNISGNLSSLSTTEVTIMLLAETDIVGDIKGLHPLGRLESVNLKDTEVVGDISFFHGMPYLLTLELSNTNVDGDISSLQNTPKLQEINLNNTGVTGNLSNIVLTDRLQILELENLNLTGCWSSYFESKCGSLYTYNFEGNQGDISNQGWIDLCQSGTGKCTTSCPDLISQTCFSRVGCEMVGGTYQAVDSVSYSGRYYISPGIGVTLNGNEGVDLSNGFYVEHGGILQIESEGCMQN